MKAMVLRQFCSLHTQSRPLQLMELPKPSPAAGEVLVRVSACGVCHTELDEIEGRFGCMTLPIVPGHEVVGYVHETGHGASVWKPGDRVGVGWIHSSSGEMDENLHPEFQATGRDVNGGYAEYMTVPEAYAFRIPELFTDAQAAPLLCAGAIGYRALRLTMIRDGESLGLTGFGGSGHLVLQLAKKLYPNTKVFVFARDEGEREFAVQLGATWAGNTSEQAPVLLHAIIDTTPAWGPVVHALASLRPGGRLVINAIRKEDDDKEQLLELQYDNHLWMEKEIKSVANITGNDIREFLPWAAQIPLRPTIRTYALEDANQALQELRLGNIRGAKVLLVDST